MNLSINSPSNTPPEIQLSLAEDNLSLIHTAVANYLLATHEELDIPSIVDVSNYDASSFFVDSGTYCSLGINYTLDGDDFTAEIDFLDDLVVVY